MTAAATGWLAQRAMAAQRRTLGKIAPRDSLAIAASSLSVGFETLDRKLFDPERTYLHLARLGVKWARVHTGWCRTELKRGEYQFAWLDAVVDNLLKIGIQPWFCVGFGNRLYTPEAPFESAVGWIPTRTDEAQRAWVRYVGALAGHYRNRVKHFEIWNEPQGKSFWRPDESSPAKYVELVKLTAPAIRERQPGAVIIGGAVAGMDTNFFQGCMECGLGEHIQKASFHSYRPIPERNYEADVGQWRKIIAKHKPGIALWHGEVGAASETGGAGGRANYPWSETRQAKWLLRRFLSDLRMQIELVSYFHTVDLVNYFGSDGPTGKTNLKGLLRGTDYTPKPAYFAYQCLCALFDSATVRAEVPMNFQNVAGAEPVKIEEIVSAGFSRNGMALHAYWHPCGHEMERADERITLTFANHPDARLTQPVLVDPLNAAVYELNRAEQRGNQWTITDAPLADHPLLVTDRSVAFAAPVNTSKAAAAAALKKEVAQYAVTITSSKDGTPQKAIFYCSTEAKSAPVPLLVALHTWSGNYEQGIEHVKHGQQRKWAVIAPDFRGPNNHPEACASDFAVQDVLDAVEYARQHARVDKERIYVVGASGGGHMALMMAARAPQLWAGVSSWVPISDLAAWHIESHTRQKRYADMLEKCCGGPPSPQTETEYRKRSPLFHLAAAKGLPLDINAGIHDGHTGSVPVNQSVRAFNVLAGKDRQVSEDAIAFMVRERKVSPLLASERENDPERQKPVLFRRVAGAVRLTIFEGGHDSELSAALEWLSRQRRGQSADHRVGKTSTAPAGAKEVAK